MGSKRLGNRATLITAVVAVIVIGIIVLIGLFVYGQTHKSTSPQARSGSGSHKATPEFRVQGTAIVRANGQPYIPLGVTIFGLAGYNWSAQEASDIAKINAIANFWHGNIVRLQVSPILLDADTNGYLAAVEKEVETAENDGLNVIISAQYEKTNRRHRHAAGHVAVEAPNDTTVTFWKTIAPIYAKDGRIWFDLFNEPVGGDRSFAVWKNGGHGVVGMQALVDEIRAVAPNNVILAEGLDYAKSLSGLVGHTLSGGNIVYSVHPYLNSTKNLTLPEWQENWEGNWGNIATKLPVIIGEWGASQSNGVGCQPDLPTLVPAFLSYISSLHLGLIGWSLIPGSMIRGHDLEDPTSFDQGVVFECSKTAGTPVQGAGADILQYLTNGGAFSNS